MPDSYRPTLFDFLAFEAIKFYQSGCTQKQIPVCIRQISAEDPVFDDMDTFLQWKPVTEDENAPLLRAIQIYQDLILFIKKTNNLTHFWTSTYSAFFSVIITHTDSEKKLTLQGFAQNFPYKMGGSQDQRTCHPSSCSSPAHRG